MHLAIWLVSLSGALSSMALPSGTPVIAIRGAELVAVNQSSGVPITSFDAGATSHFAAVRYSDSAVFVIDNLANGQQLDPSLGHVSDFSVAQPSGIWNHIDAAQILVAQGSGEVFIFWQGIRAAGPLPSNGPFTIGTALQVLNATTLALEAEYADFSLLGKNNAPAAVAPAVGGDGIFAGAISNDGTRFYYLVRGGASGDPQLCVFDLSSSTETSLATYGTWTNHTAPSPGHGMYPDGVRILANGQLLTLWHHIAIDGGPADENRFVTFTTSGSVVSDVDVGTSVLVSSPFASTIDSQNVWTVTQDPDTSEAFLDLFVLATGARLQHFALGTEPNTYQDLLVMSLGRIWPVWLNADEHDGETFVVFEGSYLGNGIPRRYNFDGNLVRSYPYDPAFISNGGAFGMTGILDANACLQKLLDEGLEDEQKKTRGMLWIAGHESRVGHIGREPTVIPIRLESGEVLTPVTSIPLDTEFDLTAGFTVLGPGAYANGNGDPTDQGLPQAVPTCAPITNLRTPSPNPGCNAGGRGFIPTYTGPSGVVPIGDDPTGEETFTGKTAIHVWIEIQHIRYLFDGTETTEVLRYAYTDLDDTLRKEGRLKAVGTIEQASSDGQGNMKSTSATASIFDEPDRPISIRRADPERKNFNRDQLTIYASSAEGRRAGATPKMLGRLLLSHDSFGSNRTATLNAVDQLHHETGSFSPDKTLPQYRFPLTHYTNAPADLGSLFIPIIVGEVSDNGAIDPTTGSLNERGKCTPRFVGMNDGRGTFVNNLFAAYSIEGLFGSDCGGLGCFGVGAVSDGKTPSTMSLTGSGDFSVIPQGGWAQLVLFTANGRSEHRITKVNIAANSVKVEGKIDPAALQPSPLTGVISWFVERIDHAPRRVKIDIAARQGVDVMVPGYAGYDKALPYVDFSCEEGDFRVTEFEAWGPLLEEHLGGGPTIATNTIGIEDKGDGTGLPITDFFPGIAWIWDTCIHQQFSKPVIDIGGGVLGYAQNASEQPKWSDDLTMTMHSSFMACQAQLAESLGGDGPKISAYFDQGIGLRDAVQLMNDNIGCWQVVEEHGRVKAFLIDKYADTSTWPRIVESERVFGNVETPRAVDEAMNWVRGGCDWDPDGGVFREDNMRAVSEPAIRRNKGYKKYSKHIDGKLIADPAVFQNVLSRKLGIHADGPIYVPIEGCDFGAVDIPIGTGFIFTSMAGPGEDGYVDHPLVKLDRITDLDGKLVGLLCLDVGTDNLLIPEGRRFIATNDNDLAPLASDECATAILAAA